MFKPLVSFFLVSEDCLNNFSTASAVFRRGISRPRGEKNITAGRWVNFSPGDGTGQQPGMSIGSKAATKLGSSLGVGITRSAKKELGGVDGNGP